MKLTDEQITHVKMLENEKGQLTPDIVLADAKRKDSPLYALFDWNKDRAAHAWWLEFSREIIRAVKIEVTVSEVTIKAPFYVRDPDATGQGYRSVMALQRDEPSARLALIEELKRAASSVLRARSIAAALNLEGECDAMLDKIVGLQHRVEAEAVAPERRAS